jgi:aminopeptidase N
MRVGAMENWGLVTYREVDLLVDKASASSRQLQRVAETVIHELAHQWFGENLLAALVLAGQTLQCLGLV